MTWAAAIAAVAAKFKEVKERGGTFGVIGSNHTTNEENRYLAAFARQVLGTGNIDHHRTGDVAALLARTASLASSADFYESKAVLVVGADLRQEHPFLAWQVRANCGTTARVFTPPDGERVRRRCASELAAESRSWWWCSAMP